MTLTGSDAFLVVDVQNDFIAGSLAVAEGKRVVAPINAIAAAMDTVVITTDWHPPRHISFASAHPGRVMGDSIPTPYGPQSLWPDHCIQGTWGAALDPDLQLDKAQLVLRKGYRPGVDSYGAFYENDGTTRSGLTGYLRARGIERLFVAGLARYYCVMQSALGAARDGFTVLMVDDASIGPAMSDAEEAAPRKTIADAGIGWIGSAALLGGQ